MIVGDRIRFEDGPYGDRIRTGSHTDFAFSVDQTVRYPANQWYADWERDAIRFAERAHGENSDDQLDHQETPQ